MAFAFVFFTSEIFNSETETCIKNCICDKFCLEKVLISSRIAINCNELPKKDDWGIF